MKKDIQISTQQQGQGYYIAQFKIKHQSIFTYYVQSDHQAYLVDPPIDSQMFKKYALQRKSTIKYILLTHYPVDYLTGQQQFENVKIIMGECSKKENNKFSIQQLKDGQSFQMGKLKTTILYTPGYTIQSSCFVLKTQKQDICVFTGDTVFLGQVGRPDLINKQANHVQEMLGKLFDSLQKIKKLKKKIRVYPGHGSGSLCGRQIHKGNYCTLGNQMQNNYGLFLQDKQQFIQAVKYRLPHLPKYSSNTIEKNKQGIEQSFEQLYQRAYQPLNKFQFKQLVQQCLITVIDTRKNAQTTGLIKGSYWFANQAYLCNWIYMILKPQQPYLLVCDKFQQKQIIQRYIRIGYVNCTGFNSFDIIHWDGKKQYPVLRNWKEIEFIYHKQFVDIRTKTEWQEKGVIQGCILIQLSKLNHAYKQIQYLKQLQKKNCSIIVHCGSGVRARFASSILLNHGIHPITLIQKFDQFKELGLKIISYEQNQKYMKQHKKLLRQKQKIDQGYQSDQDIDSQNKNRNQVQRGIIDYGNCKCYHYPLKQHNYNFGFKHPIKQHQKYKFKQHQHQKQNQTIRMQSSQNRNMIQAKKGQIYHHNKEIQERQNMLHQSSSFNRNRKQAQK